MFYEEFEDPDIIRVGEDYYLAGTTMHMNPAVQITQSKDLVNWELVGYCMDRLNLGPAFRLEGGNIYGRGIWAPCIRYHKGMFYIFSNVNGVGLQVFRSSSIKGPWERNQLPGRHDLSVLFDDDGKIYIISGGGSPYPIEELAPDLRSFNTNAPTISPTAPPTHLWLRVHCNFDTDEAMFSWSADGKQFTPLGKPFPLNERDTPCSQPSSRLSRVRRARLQEDHLSPPLSLLPEPQRSSQARQGARAEWSAAEASRNADGWATGFPSREAQWTARDTHGLKMGWAHVSSSIKRGSPRGRSGNRVRRSRRADQHAHRRWGAALGRRAER